MSPTLDTDIARLYHLNSSNERKRVADLSLDFDRKPFRFRTYPGSRRFDLPGRDFEMSVSLGEALEQRRSIRDFELGSLDLRRVGRLLYASFGVQGYRQIEGEWTYARPSPSAGGLYPLEIYLATQDVEDLPDGIYHYDARAHQLELRRTGVFHPSLADMTIGQEMIRDANLVLLISAIPERTTWKYGQRGYRYVWLDAGHLGQNIYLVSIGLGLGPVAIGGFFDRELNQLVGLPKDEEIIYLVCVGIPRDKREGA